MRLFYFGGVLSLALFVTRAESNTFFSGLMDFNGTVAGGALVEMARFEGQAASGATYNNQWTGAAGPQIGNLSTSLGVIPISSATNTDGATFFPGGRIVAVYAGQGRVFAPPAGGPPLSIDFDPVGTPLPAKGGLNGTENGALVLKIYDRGENAPPLNAADPTTWVPDFENLSGGIIGELVADHRADMASSNGRFYNQGLPLSLTALPVTGTGDDNMNGIIDQEEVNTSVIDPVGAFSGLRVDLKLLINEDMVDGPLDFFKNPENMPDDALLPPGTSEWLKERGFFADYGEDDLLIRLEEITNQAGFPQPDEMALDDMDELFDFLMENHPDRGPGNYLFQDQGSGDGDEYLVTGFATQTPDTVATTGDAVTDNTGGIGYPGAQYRAITTTTPEPSTILIWVLTAAVGLVYGKRFGKRQGE